MMISDGSARVNERAATVSANTKNFVRSPRDLSSRCIRRIHS